MKTSFASGSDGHPHSPSRGGHAMSSTNLAAWAPRLRRLISAALFAIGLVVLMTQQTGHAQQGTDPLPYTGSFLVTGNYAVGGVDLTPQANPAVNGFSSGTFTISGVPANADILAANLYWETIHLTSVTNPQAGVQLDGHDVNDPNVPFVKSSANLPLTGGACYGSGNTPYALTMMKADVLHLMPLEVVNGVPTGKRLVNGNHTVTLPNAGNGNNPPQSAGASLFVVYRDVEPDRTKNPLRKIGCPPNDV